MKLSIAEKFKFLREKVMAHLDSSFIQFMNLKFVLAQNGGKTFKIDLTMIKSVELKEEATVLHTACGVFVTDQNIEELEFLVSVDRGVLWDTPFFFFQRSKKLYKNNKK